MRNLTKKQKNELDKWIDSMRTKNVIESDNLEMFKTLNENPPFVVGDEPKWRLTIDDMDIMTWCHIHSLHPTEIHYTNVQHYLEENT